MKITYYNDGKEKSMSHEISLELNYYEERVAMAESKEEAVAIMKERVKDLVQKLQNIDWNEDPIKVNWAGEEIA